MWFFLFLLIAMFRPASAFAQAGLSATIRVPYCLPGALVMIL